MNTDELKRLAGEFLSKPEKYDPKTIKVWQAVSELINQLEVANRDIARFDWYFSDTRKTEFLDTYIQGVRESWSVDQWRAAIDAAMKP